MIPVSLRILVGSIVALAAFYIILFLYVSLSRIWYPFDLEWLEGSMVVDVQRVLAGEKLYVAPSIDFVSYQYAPLYYWVSALASLLLGVGYVPLRLVSLLSTLGTFIFLFLIVKRETRSAVSGIVASGLYAATFSVASFWFDIARVDSLFLFFLVAALYVVRHPKPSTWVTILAAVLFLLSFFTKQPAVFVFLGAAAYLTLLDLRQGLLLMAIFGVGAVVGTLILDHVNQGWYTFYTAELLREHGIIKKQLIRFWLDDLALCTPVLFALVLRFAFGELTSRDRLRLFLPFVLCGALLASWLSRLHVGGIANVVMPTYAVLAMISPMVVFSAVQRFRQTRGRREYWIALTYGIAVAVQFLYLFYNPASQIPTKADEAAGWTLVNYLRSVQGEVLIPSANYYASMAGKKTYAHVGTVYDIIRGTNKELKGKLEDEFAWAFAQRRFAVLIRPEGQFGGFIRSLAKNYDELPVRVFKGDTEFRPVIGSRDSRPDLILVPKRTASR